MTAVLEALSRAEAALADLRAALAAETVQPPPPPPPEPIQASPPKPLPPKLTLQDIADAAASLGAPVAAVQAVKEVESGPQGGFGPDGRPIILFEPHIFSRLTAHRFDATQGGVSYPKWGAKPYPKTQAERWDQLDYAANLDRPAALQSASYGLFQVMGFNFAVCDFADVETFVAAMHEGERAHLMAFVAFVKSKHLQGALAAGDWLTLATGYNGTGQAPAYASKLAAAHQKWSRV